MTDSQALLLWLMAVTGSSELQGWDYDLMGTEGYSMEGLRKIATHIPPSRAQEHVKDDLYWRLRGLVPTPAGAPEGLLLAQNTSHLLDAALTVGLPERFLIDLGEWTTEVYAEAVGAVLGGFESDRIPKFVTAAQAIFEEATSDLFVVDLGVIRQVADTL